ncbi:MAG: hypothetical protein IPM55_04895 [Acidobacteria bacterium]|nr:hypothetical protein [Acidobacteriota bacterium]
MRRDLRSRRVSLSTRRGKVTRLARGTTVNFGMWAATRRATVIFQTAVTETLRREYEITLRIVPAGDIAEIVNRLLNEKVAGKTS